MSTRNYEAMFILDNNAATADFEGTSAQVDAILERHGASIVQKDKWDDRKLAYEIRGQRRGTYYLTYFTAEPDSIRKINEDVQLSETILRHLVLTLELPIQDHIDLQASEREKLAEDSQKNALGGWGGDGRRGDRRGPPPRRREGGAPAAAAAPAAATKPAADAPAAGAAAKPAADAPAAAEAADAPAAEKPAADAPAAAPSEAAAKDTTAATEAKAES